MAQLVLKNGLTPKAVELSITVLRQQNIGPARAEIPLPPVPPVGDQTP